MHRLRTCAARLRPITASQTAKNLSQQRPAATPRTFQQLRCYTAPVAAEPFLNGTSSNYVEEMYYAWLENPKSVHKVRWPRICRWITQRRTEGKLNVLLSILKQICSLPFHGYKIKGVAKRFSCKNRNYTFTLSTDVV